MTEGYGVYFFKGNGQVVPARREMYLPVALGISNLTDAVAVRDAFKMLHPKAHWIACDERFKNVQYGFSTPSVEELQSEWAASMRRTERKLAGKE